MAIDLATNNGNKRSVFHGVDPDDQAGFSVSSAGDINGDGFEDFIIGAPFADAGASQEVGEVYVLFGSGAQRPDSGAIVAPNTVDLAGVAGNTLSGFVITGENAIDRSGFAVSSAGDLNGDGFDDLLVGVPYGDGPGRCSGRPHQCRRDLCHLRA